MRSKIWIFFWVYFDVFVHNLSHKLTRLNSFLKIGLSSTQWYISYSSSLEALNKAVLDISSLRFHSLLSSTIWYQFSPTLWHHPVFIFIVLYIRFSWASLLDYMSYHSFSRDFSMLVRGLLSTIFRQIPLGTSSFS